MSSCRAANTTTDHTTNVNLTNVDVQGRGLAIINESYGGQNGCLMQYLWMAVACQSAGGTILQNRSSGSLNPEAAGYDDHFLCRPPNETWEGVQQVDIVRWDQGGQPSGENRTEYWRDYGGFTVCNRPPHQEQEKASAPPRFRTLFTVSTVATLALMVVTVTL